MASIAGSKGGVQLKGVIMEEYTICSGCGSDTFIIYRTSIECSSCEKVYNFADTRLLTEVIDLVKDMSDD